MPQRQGIRDARLGHVAVDVGGARLIAQHGYITTRRAVTATAVVWRARPSHGVRPRGQLHRVLAVGPDRHGVRPARPLRDDCSGNRTRKARCGAPTTYRCPESVTEPEPDATELAGPEVAGPEVADAEVACSEVPPQLARSTTPKNVTTRGCALIPRSGRMMFIVMRRRTSHNGSPSELRDDAPRGHLEGEGYAPRDSLVEGSLSTI